MRGIKSKAWRVEPHRRQRDRAEVDFVLLLVFGLIAAASYFVALLCLG